MILFDSYKLKTARKFPFSKSSNTVKFGQLGGTFLLKDCHFWHYLGRFINDFV
jgi:hypothetical protein